MVEAQGGDASYIMHPEKFPKTKEVITVTSLESGYIEDLEALNLGLVSMKLGGGRAKMDDQIDHAVGLVLKKKVGDHVEAGEPLLDVHTNTGLSEELKADILSAYHIVDHEVAIPQLIEEILE